MNSLWGPVSPTEYKSVRVITGRLATEDDVKSGYAVFYLQAPEKPNSNAKPHPLRLPACALHKDGDKQTPIVIIQAEYADGRVILGARPLDGGNMACLLTECELVEPTDPRFLSSPASSSKAPTASGRATRQNKRLRGDA